MNTLLTKLYNHIFAAEMKLEARIFYLLCFIGFIAVLVAAFVRGLWISGNIVTFVYLFTVAIILGLGFIFFKRLRAHKSVIIIMLCAVLMVFFPLTFFSSGGIDSGLTAYFVLSLSVLFVLLHGKTCVIMACLHIAVAMSCYHLGYTHPELVTPLRSRHMVAIDSVLAITFSGLVLCLLIKIQTDAYIEEKRNALMAAKARSDFLANISHEIRTPLNAIIGVSEIEKNSGNNESLRQMHESGMTLLGIINDILDISKMEAGRFSVLPVQYKFTDLAQDILRMNVGRESKSHLNFKINISENLPGVLYGDEHCIKQIAGNVLSNAFKYTDEGGVELDISSKIAPNDKYCLLQIKVSDTGRGIMPEDQEKIFAEYGKLDTDATAVEGIGLGLTICKNLTEMMDGSITVQSELEKGSSFTVIIPQKIIDPRPIGREAASRIALNKQRSNSEEEVRFNGTVLVVDDVDINLEVAATILGNYGLNVDTALSGEEAITLIEGGKKHYDLIFLDNLMPGMSGAETMREIRKIDSENARNVPIIGLTAGERGEGNDDGFFDEIQALLSKPVDVQRLEKILNKWLKKTDPER